MVEHDLAKVGVASSNLVFRSKSLPKQKGFIVKGYYIYLEQWNHAQMVELVDTQDLKSCACMGVRVQVPLRVQERKGRF